MTCRHISHVPLTTVRHLLNVGTPIWRRDSDEQVRDSAQALYVTDRWQTLAQQLSQSVGVERSTATEPHTAHTPTAAADARGVVVVMVT